MVSSAQEKPVYLTSLSTVNGNTLSGWLQTCLFSFYKLHFICVVVIWKMEQMKRSNDKWTEQGGWAVGRVAAPEESCSTTTGNNREDGKAASKLREPNIQNFEVQQERRCLFLGLLVEKGRLSERRESQRSLTGTQACAKVGETCKF